VKMAIFYTCGSNNWKTVEDRWVHAARGLASIELSFHSSHIWPHNRRGVSRGKQKYGLRYVKTAIFCTCGSNNWKTVENRWVHAARGLVSIKLSFHPCNILREGRL